MNVVFLADILITLIAIGYTAHLVYVRYNPKLAERRYKKYKANPRARELYRKFYSPRFLVIAVIMSLSLALSLAVDIIALVNGSIPSSLKMLELITGTVTGLAVLYLVYTLFREKR